MRREEELGDEGAYILCLCPARTELAQEQREEEDVAMRVLGLKGWYTCSNYGCRCQDRDSRYCLTPSKELRLKPAQAVSGHAKYALNIDGRLWKDNVHLNSIGKAMATISDTCQTCCWAPDLISPLVDILPEHLITLYCAIATTSNPSLSAVAEGVFP